MHTISPDDLDFGKNGQKLLPVVIQNTATREVCFVGSTNRVAFRNTMRDDTVWLWSRSRRQLWHKGATSGDFLHLVDIRVNCEQNSLLYLVEPQGKGVCHIKDESGVSYQTCFFRCLE